MCELALAWVTSENSTSTGMPTSFDSIFFAVAGPSLLCYCLRSPVLTVPVRGSTPTLCFSVANCSRLGPIVNCLPAPLSSQLSFASPYHFRIRRDFRSKNPLSGFAPKQTKESSAQATHIVLHPFIKARRKTNSQFKKNDFPTLPKTCNNATSLITCVTRYAIL